MIQVLKDSVPFNQDKSGFCCRNNDFSAVYTPYSKIVAILVFFYMP